MRLSNRVADLERHQPESAKRWVRVFQHEGQSRDQAVAAWEAEHGPADDRNIIVRVIIDNP